MNKYKFKVLELPEAGTLEAANKVELQEKLQLKEKLGLCFGGNEPNDTIEQIRGIDFSKYNYVTINLGKYLWITLERVILDDNI